VVQPPESHGVHRLRARRAGGRRYRKERTFRWRPKEEWIAIPVPAYLSRELVDRARAVVGSGRARERKHLTRDWELRGMIRCGCGRKMGTRTAESRGRLFFYYVCRRSPVAKKTGKCAQGCIRATRVEEAVWHLVSSLLKDPDRIRLGIEELIEQEREAAHSDPKQEATPWEEKITECSRLRSAYQDQQAAGLMTLEELASKLAKLEETAGSRQRNSRRWRLARSACVSSRPTVTPSCPPTPRRYRRRWTGSRARSAPGSTGCCSWR
jgi:site-specific DNA recombinase